MFAAPLECGTRLFDIPRAAIARWAHETKQAL